MMTAFLCLLGIPVILLIGGFLLMVFIDCCGPAILTVFLFIKWTIYTVVELIRCLFRSKDTTGPA